MIEVQTHLYKTGGVISVHICNYLVSMPSGISLIFAALRLRHIYQANMVKLLHNMSFSVYAFNQK